MSVHCGPSGGLEVLSGQYTSYITPADRKVPPWRREGPSKRQRDPSRAPLGGLRCTRFVDKHVQESFGEEAAPAARRDVSGPITLFRSTAASRREPTGEMGAAALDRAASEARAAADDQPT